jgi:hypothetical protein
MEMTMSVTGERTEHSATTAAVDVTYWTTEFERVLSGFASAVSAADRRPQPGQKSQREDR